MKVGEVLEFIEVEKLVVISNNGIEKFKSNNLDTYIDNEEVKIEEKYSEREIIYISVSRYNELELVIK